MNGHQPPEASEDFEFKTSFVPLKQNAGSEHVVDLVFVSGLDSHIQPHTSTWGTPKFFWPTELGRSLPGARILVWEVAREMGVNTRDAVSLLGDMLLRDLFVQRGASQTPLIFIAHSFGGLIVKSALLKAEGSSFSRISSISYASILDQTRGICFFGTPQAWGRETWRHAISAVRKALAARNVESTPETPTSVDSIDSDEMRDQSRMFRRIVNSLSIPILTFYETETTPTNRGNIVIVGEDIAQLRTVNERVIPRHANHNNIAKFYNPQDRDYRRVRDFVTMVEPSAAPKDKALTVGKTTVPSIQESETAAKESTLLHALRFDWLSPDGIADCDDTTCDWLLKTKQWEDWLSQPKQPLWIFGAPGMGKTVLSKFILQELRKQDRQDLLGTPTHTIGYFFDDRVEARRNLNGLIRTLLYLFLLSDTELFRHVRGKYISTTPSLTNDYLIEILNTILEDTKLGQVALIIEGLDECSAATEPEMIDFISSLKDKPNVRLIVTARPQDQIKTAYLPMNSLDLDANSLSPTSSIKLYVKEEIQRVLGESESFPKDFLYEVERVLLNRPSPNFLWVKVAIRYIELQRTILLSRKAIRDLPPGSKVDPLFQKYLQTEFLFDKIPLPSIYIVMEAKAPMTVLGLSFLSAATFEEQSSLINLPDLKMSTIRESTIKNFEYEVADFPFLQVGDNGVSLMHSSLRGILKDTFSPHNGFNTQNGRSTLATRLLEPARKGVEPFLAAVNYFIAELCLTYLLASLQENLDPLDFLRYATLYWFEHVQEAAEHAEKWKKEIEERNRDFSIRNIKIPLAVLDVLTGDNGRKLKEIQELTKTRFGIDKTTFAENDECSITVRGTAKATSIARSLLNKIIEAEKLQQTRRPDSPIEVGYLKTGQGTDSYIIDDEREVKQQDANLSDIINPPETLLSLVKALFCSEKTCHDWTKKPEAHCSVFTKWIRQYTKYDITREKALPVEDTCDTTTFALAAFNLYHILGDHLIEGPANKSLVAKDQNGHTPMHFIVLNNSLASLKWVQERLLADSEFQKFHTLAFQSIEEDPEKLESCPVYLAAEYGNKEMVQLFANSALHAPIQSRQRLGRLLHTVAAKNRHKDIFLLLHEGHFLDLLPEDQQAVAESAATLDCLDVVKKILLEHEGKISTTELLHCAIRSCAEHTIDFLLPLVDINKTSTNGRTALHEAAEVGNDKIVTKLLDRGAFVNALDAARQTPLHLVSKVGFATVCELLLKAGARVSLVDGSGSIPVHYAAANGHDKVLALLVAAGSNLFAADKDGRGPLHLASQATHESSGSTVQALLSLNARVGARDKKGRTSLHYAAQSGNKTIVWMLVDAGADLNVQDDFGVAPIHLAAAGSSDVMITELLRLGADATVRDNERRSVYYHCMASDRPSRAVFQALMENKVPVVGAEISFSAKSREWLEEFEGLVGDVAVSDANGGRKITLTTQSTDEFVRGVVYADDRAESPDNMFRELRALPGGGGASGGRRYGRR